MTITKQFWWCSYHVDSKAQYNGIYVRNQEKDHDEAVERNKNFSCNQRERRGTATTTKLIDNPPNKDSSKKLVLEENMKKVLASHLLPLEQINPLLEEALKLGN